MPVVLKHTWIIFKKYNMAPKKWSYKLFLGIGVNILFIITWIRVQKNKRMDIIPGVHHTAISRQ